MVQMKHTRLTHTHTGVGSFALNREASCAGNSILKQVAWWWVCVCAGLFNFTPALLFVRKARSGRRGKTGHDFRLYFENIIDEPFTHENGTVTPSCDALDHIFSFYFFFRHVALLPDQPEVDLIKLTWRTRSSLLWREKWDHLSVDGDVILY